MNKSAAATNLAVTVYHFIKQTPEYHHQADYRCGSGMCFAGWAVSLDPQSTFLFGPKHSWADYVSSDSSQRGSIEVLNSPSGAGMHLQQRAIALLELDVNEYEESALFAGSNTLLNIRAHIEEIYGVDPENEIPDAELMLLAKEITVTTDWTKE